MITLTHFAKGEERTDIEISGQAVFTVEQGDDLLFADNQSIVKTINKEGLNLSIDFTDGSHLLIEDFFFANQPNIETVLTFADALFTSSEIDACFEVGQTTGITLQAVRANTASASSHVLKVNGQLTGANQVITTENTPFVYQFQLSSEFSEQSEVEVLFNNGAMPAWMTIKDLGENKYVLSGTPQKEDVGKFQIDIKVTDVLKERERDTIATVRINVNSGEGAGAASRLANVQAMSSDSGFMSSSQSFGQLQSMHSLGAEFSAAILPAVAIASAAGNYRTAFTALPFVGTLVKPLDGSKSEAALPETEAAAQVIIEEVEEDTTTTKDGDIIKNEETQAVDQFGASLTDIEPTVPPVTEETEPATEETAPEAAPEAEPAPPPPSEEVIVPPAPAPPLNSLFTEGDDTLNFNDLTSLPNFPQEGIYNALGGNDNVTLPNQANAATLGFDPTIPFEGGEGNDTIIGTDAADVINGGPGNDFINAGISPLPFEQNIIDGGAGNDTYSYEGHPSGVNVIRVGMNLSGSSDDTSDVLMNIENIIGSDDNDTIEGTDASNVLEGRGGNDNLFGFDGNDTLLGGADSDLLDGGLGADVLDGGAGSDELSYISAGSGIAVNTGLGIGTGGEAAGDTVSNFETINGSSFGDTITGGGGVTTIRGFAGDDVLTGSNVDELFQGGSDNDTISDLGGADTVQGGTGNDTVIAGTNLGVGNDVYDGGPDTDTIDFSTAGSGAFIDLETDSANVGANFYQITNFENVVGSGFNDQIFGNAATGNVISGGGGGDMIEGLGGNDTLNGDAGNDTLIGGAGMDILNGGADNDTLDGGGIDIDVLNGGSGNDILVYDSADLAGAMDSINGGADFDTLLVNTGGETISTFDVFDNIEQIDLTDIGDTQVNIGITGAGDILGSSTDDTLIILGETGDEVTYTAAAWTDMGVVAGFNILTGMDPANTGITMEVQVGITLTPV